jgi:hypothetical protein
MNPACTHHGPLPEPVLNSRGFERLRRGNQFPSSMKDSEITPDGLNQPDGKDSKNR